VAAAVTWLRWENRQVGKNGAACCDTKWRDENGVLLGSCAASSGKSLQTLRTTYQGINRLSERQWDPTDFPETSVRNFHYSLHNNPEKHSSHLLRGGCLKSRKWLELCGYKLKVKRTLVQALRLWTGLTAHRVSRGTALLFLDHGTRRGEGSVSRPGRSLPPGNTLYPLYRKLGGPQGRSGQMRKISPPQGFDPRIVQSVASRYTDYATRPTNFVDMLSWSVGFSQPMRNVRKWATSVENRNRYMFDINQICPRLLTSVLVHVNIRGALSQSEDSKFVQSGSNAVGHNDSLSALAYDNLCYTDGIAKGDPRHSQCLLPHRTLPYFITQYN